MYCNSDLSYVTARSVCTINILSLIKIGQSDTLSPVMTGSWLARPRSSSLVLVEVHGEEHRDGQQHGQDGVEGIGDAERVRN